MKKYINYGIIAAVSILIGRYVLQPKQEVKTVEVIKYIEKKQESSNTNRTTTTRETTNPDGTRVTETTTTETSNSQTSTNISSSQERQITASSKKGISFGILAIKDFPKFEKSYDYGIIATIPLVGNLSISTLADTSKRIGIGLSLEF